MNNNERISIKREIKHRSEINARYFFRQIKTVKQIIAFKVITTQNQKPAPKKNKLVKKKAYLMLKNP